MRPSTAGLALALLGALVLGAGSARAQQGGTAMVFMADGGSFPLRAWSLSCEFSAWRAGTPPYQAAPQRRETHELWLGKKTYPLLGATLEIEYGTAQREREVAGETKLVPVRVAKSVAIVGTDGKRLTLKLEAPARDLVIPGAEKDMLLAVRSLDLQGETLTGTKSSLCLLSFSSLVECPDDPGRQVVKVEFQP